MAENSWADIEQQSPLYIVLPYIRVTSGELTCLECGETFHPRLKGCPRCASSADEMDSQFIITETRTVATVSYLQEHEYRVIG